MKQRIFAWILLIGFVFIIADILVIGFMRPLFSTVYGVLILAFFLFGRRRNR